MTKNLEQQLKDIEKQVNEIINNNATLGALFPDSFMCKYTKFNSLDDFFEQSSFKHETEENLDAIDEKELDKYVKENTQFECWEDMKQTAGNLYAKKKLEEAGIEVTLS